MLEKMFTTKMSSDKKKLENRFLKIRSKNSKTAKITAMILFAFIIMFVIGASVYVAVNKLQDDIKNGRNTETLYELKNTNLHDIKNIEKIVELSNFTPYEFNSIEIVDNEYEKRVAVKFMAEDRSMHRITDDISLRKLSLVLLALVPESDGVSCLLFDKYSEDINNWETCFYSAYTPKDSCNSREQFEKFTLEYIKNATLNKENFKEFYNSLLLIESNEELSDYIKQQYDFIGNDYEVVVNSGIGAEFLTDKEFLNSPECDNINKLFNVDLTQYEGIAVNLNKTTIRNFKTNENKKHIKLYYFEGDKTKFISQKIIEKGKLSDEVKHLIQILMEKEKVNYIYNAENLSYVQIKALQYQVNNGHFPWRLDYKQVIQSFFFGKGIDAEKGVITAFAGDSQKCSATYEIDADSYEIELFKPIDKSEKGIWIVKSYKKKETGKVSEIFFYERTPEQAMVENKEDGWYRVSGSVRAVFQFEGDLPKIITAYFTPAGTETESLKEEVAKIEQPFSFATMAKVPFMDINFPEWCTLGHLEFEFDYGEGIIKKSQLYNYLIE